MQGQLVIDGVTVHVEGQGQETILMIHGWPHDRRLWDAQVEAMSPLYRCVRFSFSGPRGARGRSLDEVSAMFAQTVQRISPDRPVVLMLNDWGCVYGYQFAMRFPELVSRIIGVGIGGSTQASFRGALDWGGRLKLALYNIRLSMAERTRVEAQKISAHLNCPYAVSWFNDHPARRSALPFKLRCPMLFIYGRRRPFQFHTRNFEQAVQAKPGSKVMAFRSGHWVMREQPDAFNDAVLGWLQAPVAPAEQLAH
jgi:pimeloyl-ACP methyl ester carboxylesterase